MPLEQHVLVREEMERKILDMVDNYRSEITITGNHRMACINRHVYTSSLSIGKILES